MIQTSEPTSASSNRHLEKLGDVSKVVKILQYQFYFQSFSCFI
jgi:hypothetical protein